MNTSISSFQATPCNAVQLLSLLSPQTLMTLPRPEPSICSAKRRLSAAIALSNGYSRFRDPPADVFTTLTTVPCALRTRTRGEGRERTAREGKAEKRERGSERKRAGGASIYQRRREVGGCMRRIAPYGRSLINSGRRRSDASVYG